MCNTTSRFCCYETEPIRAPSVPSSWGPKAVWPKGCPTFPPPPVQSWRALCTPRRVPKTAEPPRPGVLTWQPRLGQCHLPAAPPSRPGFLGHPAAEERFCVCTKALGVHERSRFCSHQGSCIGGLGGPRVQLQCRVRRWGNRTLAASPGREWIHAQCQQRLSNAAITARTEDGMRRPPPCHLSSQLVRCSGTSTAEETQAPEHLDHNTYRPLEGLPWTALG